MDEEDASGVARALNRSMSMASLDKWLTRLAILGAAAAVVAGTLFWLVLTRPVAVADLLHRIL